MFRRISGSLCIAFHVVRFQRRTISKALILGLGVAGANCENANSNVILSHNANETLKYACLLNVNAASSLLTSIVCAIEDTSEKYNETMMKLISKLDECLLLNGWNDELWESVIVLRNEVNSLKMELTHFTSLVESVNKVATSTIELSFNLNANSLCTTLCEHNHLAEEKLSRLEKEIKQKEEMYLTVQAEVAKNHKDLHI